MLCITRDLLYFLIFFVKSLKKEVVLVIFCRFKPICDIYVLHISLTLPLEKFYHWKNLCLHFLIQIKSGVEKFNSGVKSSDFCVVRNYFFHVVKSRNLQNREIRKSFADFFARKRSLFQLYFKVKGLLPPINKF